MYGLITRYLEFCAGVLRWIQYGNKKKYACVQAQDKIEGLYAELGVSGWLIDNNIEIIHWFSKGLAWHRGEMVYDEPRFIVRAEDVNFVLVATDKFKRIKSVR